MLVIAADLIVIWSLPMPPQWQSVKWEIIRKQTSGLFYILRSIYCTIIQYIFIFQWAFWKKIVVVNNAAAN